MRKGRIGPISASGGAAPPPVTLAYTNYGGQASRIGLIDCTFSGAFGGGAGGDFVSGRYVAGMYWNGGQTSQNLVFNFKNSRVIDELKWYQTDSSTHGTWQFEGSHDNSSWTTLGSSFTLGGSTSQTITAPSANTTAYQYYRLHQVSGSTNSSPYLLGVDFHIGNEITKGYFGTYGVGDRHASITASGNIVGGSNGFFDGAYATTSYINGGSSPFHVDFGSAVILNECLWYQNTNNTHSASSQWEYSDDDSTWFSYGSTFTAGGGSQLSMGLFISRQTALNGNTGAHRYWRLNPGAGAWNSSPYILEVEFSIG